jgi:O-antigen/teichoic acid export membrane protein
VSLKQKTISGIFWASIQKIGSRGISLIVTIILARILAPSDFGLIGMLTVFIAISQTLVNAGFSQALIQKKNADEEDYSSVFYINLVASIFLYGILFFSASLIADFYHQPVLVDLTRILALIFIINAFSYVQETRLTKEIRFKTLMFIHLPSTIISGVVAIGMAYLGYGVWSIVVQQLVMRLAYAIQLWIYSRWKPLASFNKAKAKELFSFGSKLLISGIIYSLYDNIYLIIIGKFFSVNTLGYYQNAKKLVNMPTQTLSSVLKSVTFPVFSSIQDDNRKLKEGYKKIIQQLLFWLCPILVFAAVLANPLFSFVLTSKWLPAVPFFQLLCVVGIFYPLNSYNLNIVSIKGRSDLFLKLSIFKRAITTVGIILIIPYGIWPLLFFEAASAVFMYFVNSYYSGRFIDYPIKEQLKDVYPILIVSSLVGIVVLFINYFLVDFTNISRLVMGFGIGIILYWGLSKYWKIEAYTDFKQILNGKFYKNRNISLNS